jgi:hypothetical protein
MAQRKQKSFLDWYGNPIPDMTGPGICTGYLGMFFMGETEHGKRYLRSYDQSGVPGDRVSLDDCRCVVKDDAGKVVYDSDAEPPADAKLLPNYIGFAREKQLKRYFPG